MPKPRRCKLDNWGTDWIYIKSWITDRERRRLEQQRAALIEQRRGLGHLMRGTGRQVGVTCGRVGCACEGGEKHQQVHLSVNLGGRTRGGYWGREREALVAPLIAEYQRAWRVINELTAVNLALVRGRHPGGRPGRQRKRRAA